MTANLIPIYGCAALTITTLGFFARQNRKSGWKRNRTNMAEAIGQLYSDLGFGAEESHPLTGTEWKPVTPDEAIGFSAQMLTLRGAVGTSTPVTAGVRLADRELVHQ